MLLFEKDTKSIIGRPDGKEEEFIIRQNEMIKLLFN